MSRIVALVTDHGLFSCLAVGLALALAFRIESEVPFVLGFALAFRIVGFASSFRFAHSVGATQANSVDLHGRMERDFHAKKIPPLQLLFAHKNTHPRRTFHHMFLHFREVCQSFEQHTHTPRFSV